ncbi:MAG: ankyrin repeat domain-containing protein [Treponema sp.]|nr:ankyrin repeat domain-containing protein [Treponema sp.]
MDVTVVFAKADRKTKFQRAIDKNKKSEIAKLIKKSSLEENVDGLLAAAASNSVEAVTVFLEAGIDVNSVGNDNQTPLISACSQSGNVEMVKLLLEKGANVSSVDSEGRSALYHTIMRVGKIYEIMRNRAGQTYYKYEKKDDKLVTFVYLPEVASRPFRISELESKMDDMNKMIKLLIQFGVDVNERYQGHSMFFIAEKTMRAYSASHLLVDAGAKYTEEENLIEEKKREFEEEARQAEQLRLKQERERKRVTSDNFYSEVIYHTGIPIKTGDEFLIDKNRIQVLDRTTTQAGYTYLVTYYSTAYERSRDYANSFSGGGAKYCFYIVSKKEMALHKTYSYTTNASYITSVNDLKLTCTGISQYQHNYQDVDCYVFTLDAEL